jgi:DNA (cytosine-5)-methyltransferase 1
MTHVSLFAGIGGFDLAAEWAGFETILQVEIDDYARKVLEKHWPNVKRIKDIRDVKKESVEMRPTVVSGGFPCQPFSHAGKRRGREDDRYLWPEMLRVIRELMPTWAVAENVPGLLSIDEGLEIERVFASLETEGYETLPLVYPACGVGALHRRNRIFIVAHTVCVRWKRRKGSERRFNIPDQGLEALADTKGERFRETGYGFGRSEERFTGESFMADANRDGKRRDQSENKERRRIEQGCENVADAHVKRLSITTCGKFGEFRKKEGKSERGKFSRGITEVREYWAVEPDVGRVAHGIPHRVDRLKGLGNAVVPQQAYPIFAAIAEYENYLRTMVDK